MSSYIEVALEKRINNDSHKAKYNIYEDANESKEYYSVIDRNATNKHTSIAKSHNKNDWETVEYNNDDKTEGTKPYNDVKIDNIFSDFDIDVNPMFKQKQSKDVKHVAKLEKPAKSSKSAKVPKSAKKSVKKTKKPKKSAKK